MTHYISRIVSTSIIIALTLPTSVLAQTVPITHTLTVGSEGQEVSTLQSILSQLSLFTGEITGYFGQITKQAVMAFQKAHDLDPVGIVGPLTRSVLNNTAAATAYPTPGKVLGAATGACNISAPTSVTDRKVRLTMAGCAGVRRFQVSESPDFSHPSGVQINLSNVATDLSAADVSITYKNGVPGGNGTPYSLPEKRTINALAVLYEFADANGQDNGTGAYETPTFLKRFIFGDGIIGYEGYYKYNSYKDHLLQSTAGRVTLTGDTYPTIVHIPLEKFRTFLDGPIPNTVGEIIATIKREDPTYFDTRDYDYIFPLASSHYAVERGYQGGTYNGAGYMKNIMPWDKTTSIFANTIQEVRTAHDAQRVVTRYNASTVKGEVEGVWLASDTARSGTNYFTGGSILWDSGIQHNHITLGTPLPSPNEQVIVRYKANAGPSVDSSTADTLTNSGWGSHMWHENYHIISTRSQMQFSQRRLIGDPYFTPALLPGYDAMTHGLFNPPHPTLGHADGTPLLSAANKYEMGYVTPYTLEYGENETNKRLARAEFSDVSHVEDNTTMIKIPLRKLGDPGLATKQRALYYSELGVPTDTTNANKAAPAYSGEEYLLIELRSKAPLPSGKYNFDEAVRSGGLVVYHMVEVSPYEASLHNGADIAEVIDATPPYLSGHTNITGSAAAFGPESGVYQLNLQALWQDKPLDSTTHAFDYMLSEGRGAKTLYARFVDTTGNSMGTQTITLSLDSDQTATQRLPTVALSPVVSGYGTGARKVTANFVAPNGATSINFYMDQYLVRDQTLLGVTTGTDDYYFNDSKFSPGAHSIRAVVTDKAKISVAQSVPFTTGTSQGPTVTLTANPTAIAQGQSATLSWSSTNATACHSPNTSFSASSHFGSFTVNPTVTTTYTITCSGYGLTSAPAYATVTVTGTNTDTTAPSVPTGLSASAVSSSQINLSWSASTDSVGVTGYKVSRGSTQIATATGTSYQNTGLAPSTTYSYTVAAFDAAGNTSVQSSAVSITTLPAPDTTAPTTSITSPSGGAILSGTVTVSASASDNVGGTGVAKVELWKDGVVLGIDTASPYSFSWDTTLDTNTSHTLQTKAYDEAGNVGSSDTTSVTVDNTVMPPPPVPTATLSANPTSITAGQSSTLTYSSTDATTCTGVNFVPTSISGLAVVTPTLTTTYSITCTGAGGTSPTASATVTVASVTPNTLAIGSRVKTTVNLNVRSKANTKSGKILCVQPTGALGVITAGPSTAQGLLWWKVNYDTSCDGWSAINNGSGLPYLVPATSVRTTPSTLLTGEPAQVITSTLARGSTGEEVVLLQYLLQKFDHFTGELTGYFGPLTEQSVVKFQQENNLAGVGIVGPQTRALLNSLGF